MSRYHSDGRYVLSRKLIVIDKGLKDLLMAFRGFCANEVGEPCFVGVSTIIRPVEVSVYFK